ncbi:MAG: hypothetical protein COB34_03000 [Methylophilaceae bacterium]|nr:MAG: hypothetical protein COB34_03000 [Methylophilaceae bacterium]
MVLDQSNTMILSNQAIATITSLTLKARKNIGVFKVADIIIDHQYACEFFTQAILSGDDELVSLTIEANKELNIEKNLINALSDYLHEMQLQSKSINFIKSSKYLLRELAKHLYGVKLEDVAYRQATNEFLLEMDEQDKAFGLNLVRSFHPCWKKTNDILADGNKDQPLDGNAHKKDLIQLWGGIDDAFVTTIEESQLSRYLADVQRIGVLDEEVQLRMKIAKVIIIKQRQHTKTSIGYRNNINEIQHYFSNARLLDYFLSVSREFYSVWLDSKITASDR